MLAVASTPNCGQHWFSHQAMATVFEVCCEHPDREYACQAAWSAFDLLDRLEQDLSQFIENSDVSRINTLRAGQSTQVGRATMDCLLISRLAYLETGGAFDISLSTGLPELDLLRSELRVHANASGIHIDLGGMGKGYAVDRMAELLIDWDVERAFIHSGTSSVRALNPPSGSEGWPLTMSKFDGTRYDPFALVRASQRVFSSSGRRNREHISDPRGSGYVNLRSAAWVSAQVPALAGFCQQAHVAESPAAVAEVFSTAFLMVGTGQINELCARYPGLESWLIDAGENGKGESPVVTHLPFHTKRGHLPCA